MSPLPPPNPAGFVYIARGGPDGLVKIGYTGRLKRRLAEICQDPKVRGPVAVLGLLVGGADLEGSLLYRFRSRWLHHEWFLPNEKMLVRIAKLRSVVPVPFRFESRLQDRTSAVSLTMIWGSGSVEAERLRLLKSDAAVQRFSGTSTSLDCAPERVGP